MVIGREKETGLLKEKLASGKSEFIALYGRRRVGKTFLIRNVFNGQFTFRLTGLAQVTLSQQLSNYNVAMHEQHPNTRRKKATDWMEAFQQIREVTEKSKQKKKIIFIDELPWFDTTHSGF